MAAPDDDGGEPAPAGSGGFDSVVGRMEAQLARGRPSGAVEAPDRGPVSARVASASASSAAPSGRGFVAGIGFGIAGLATAVQLWLAYELAPLQQMFREFGATPPAISRIVVSAGWRYGTVVALIVLISAAHWIAPRRRWPLVAVAVLAVAIVMITYVAARLPFSALSGSITSE